MLFLWKTFIRRNQIKDNSNRQVNNRNIFVFFVSVLVCFVSLSLPSVEGLEDDVPSSSFSTSSSLASSGGDSTQSPVSKPITTDTEKSETDDALKLYRRLLRQKRISHLEAIKAIVELGSYEKQFKMIDLILTKLFSVMADNRIKLMENGFVAGDAFPSLENVRDAFSIVTENTAFMGEITLRLPDMTHALLNKNKEWQLLVRWAVGFCNDTNVFERKDSELLHLMAQELGIIEMSPDYINPFREDIKLEKIADKIEKEMHEKEKKLQKKDKKEKKKRKGPKMTSAKKHNEL